MLLNYFNKKFKILTIFFPPKVNYQKNVGTLKSVKNMYVYLKNERNHHLERINERNGEQTFLYYNTRGTYLDLVII